MRELKLPALFQDGAVLQRHKPICIWGEADDSVQVEISLGEISAVAKPVNGQWRAYLPPMQAATGLTLRVQAGAGTVIIRDVAVGEVWLAGGQSNMEFLLRDDANREEAVRIKDPDIRCYEVPKVSYEGQEADRDYSQVGVWRRAENREAEYFSAVGFYFARYLREKLRVPVGIINCTWGGTSASAWVAEEDLTGELEFYLNRAREARKALDPKTEKDEFKKIQQMIDSLPPMNAVVNEAPLIPTEEMKTSMEQMDRYNLCAYSPFRPCGLYHTMLKKAAPYTISGVLWYQGESDEYFGDLYEPLTRNLIKSWRSLWGEELPFLVVQLASFDCMMEKLDFVPIREMQRRIAEDTPHVHLVCTMDVGLRYDIHPKKKQPVGERLALQALHRVYGYRLLSDSPVLKEARKEGDTMILSFHYGEGLHAETAINPLVEVFADGKPLREAMIRISEDRMLITGEELSAAQRVEVRFAWLPYCEDQVYNAAGLPMLPFRTLWQKERKTHS